MPADTGTPLVLVVEDDDDVRQSLLELLEAEGLEVGAAANGTEALARLERGGRTPDLIILDLKMPEMGGAEFREHQMRDARWSKIPVLVLTADVDVAAKMGSIRAGAYLKKPLRVEPLLGLIRQMLAARSRVL